MQMITGAVGGSLCAVLRVGASMIVKLANTGAFVRFAELSSADVSEGLFAAAAVGAALRVKGIVCVGVRV